MKMNPFSKLSPYADVLRVGLFTKEHTPLPDEQYAAVLGATVGVAALRQIHGTRTISVESPVARTEEADGLCTSTPGLALTIRTADCQSFLVYAPEQRTVGLLHVGWKGLIAGAIPSFFRELFFIKGITPEQTIVCAGPSLCIACAEFTDPSTELSSLDSAYIHGRCVDLRGAAEQQLLDLGVHPAKFERHPDCTRCHPEQYWTYRGGDREQVIDGACNILVVSIN